VIDLPEIVLRKNLDSQLVRGKVLSTKIIFPKGSRFKRMLLLNKNFSEENVYYLFTTSQVRFYIKHKDEVPLKGNFIYIKKGGTPLNSDEPMVIDCRNIYPIKKEKLLENYKNKILRYRGDMPKEIMTEIDKIISASKLIPPKIKNHVI